MFSKGWFLSLMGFILLSIIIVYVAPLINEKNSTLLTISGIAGLIVVGAVFQLIRLLRVHRENAAILNSLKNMGSAARNNAAANEEIGLLEERISDAVSELKNSRGKDSGKLHYLYRVPWYILIGPPASGKTTLLKNSSLRTVLSKKFGRETVSGIGGTRHCDWWFAEDAVLLDTAGRYTTQDSNKVQDGKAWLGFLNLLQKNRERRPINGVMIAISIDELLLSDNLHQRAHEVRQRIQELYEQFSLTLPVYLIFTKTDLLDGFAEFFADQDKKVRRQVWGVTFTDDNDVVKTPLPEFLAELNLLEDTLKEQLPYKLEGESTLERRRKIYAFPEQFAELKSRAYQFAHEVFADTKGQHNVLFRGAYFTSAEQIGAPINKLLANLSRTFGFEQAPIATHRNRGKSYFIDDVLQKVVFPEAELAGLNPAYEKKMRFLQRLTIASVVLITLLSIGLWGVSHQKNKADIQFVQQQTTELKRLTLDAKGDESLKTSLVILNQAMKLHEQKNADSILATFGLSQHNKLRQQVNSAYQRILYTRLLPSILDTLERGLRKNTNDTTTLFKYLQSYLILTPQYTQHYQAHSVVLRELLLADWQKNDKNELSLPQLQELANHLDAFITMQPVLTTIGLQQKKKLIEQARKILSKNSDISARANWVLEEK